MIKQNPNKMFATFKKTGNERRRGLSRFQQIFMLITGSVQSVQLVLHTTITFSCGMELKILQFLQNSLKCFKKRDQDYA